MKNFNQKVHPFLMFSGQAEEAMLFYTSIFTNSEIVSITRYGANEAGAEGSVMQAIFSVKGQEIMCIDSSIQHDFTFTPAISLFVTCDTEEEVKLFLQNYQRAATCLCRSIPTHLVKNSAGLAISLV